MTAPSSTEMLRSGGERATGAADQAAAIERRKRRVARRRWIRRGILAFIVFAIAGAIALAWMPRPIPVDAADVERGPLVVTVDEDGKARVRDRYVVSAPLAGTLARIEHEAGDPVREGQIVARIVPLLPSLLDERTQKSAEARLSAAVAAQKRARAEIERARANAEYAKTDANRQRELFARASIPRAELDRAVLAERMAEAQVESLRFGARVADYEVEMARAALRTLEAPGKRGKQEHLEVSSPVDGRVLTIAQESASVVQPGAPLIEIGDPAALEIAVDVLTSDAIHIGTGANVILERWGGDPLEGKVRRIEPSAFTRLSALGVEEQRVNVLIDIVSPRDQWANMGDGYRVEARIVVWEAASVIKVPASALFRRGEGWAAFRIEGGKARLTPLNIGHRTAREAEILGSGLDSGTKVVVHPSDRVVDGVEVTVR